MTISPIIGTLERDLAAAVTAEQTLHVKLRIEDASAAAKQQLAIAKTRAYTTGAFLPSDQYRDLENTVRVLGRLTQRAALQASTLRRQEHLARETERDIRHQAKLDRTDKLAQAFLAVCRELLSEGQFARLMEEAHMRAFPPADR